MAITVTPMPSALGAVGFIATRIQDETGQEWVAHTYPGRDGQEVEAVGRRPRICQVEGVFIGPDWLDRVVQVQELANADAVTTFTHPYLLQLEGVIQDLRMDFDLRRRDHAAVSFRFTEAAPALQSFSVALSVPSAITAADLAITDATAALEAL